MLTVGSPVTAAGYAAFALSAARPPYGVGFLPGFVLTGVGMTACVAPLTTVVLDAAPAHLGGSASGVNNAAARLCALVAVAALGFAFGGASDPALATAGIIEAYRRVMWESAVLAVAAAGAAVVRLGRGPAGPRDGN